MTLVSQIIHDAYRESNLIAISAEPTDAEKDEALRLLNRYILSLFGNEMGDPLKSIPYGQNNVEQPAYNYIFYEMVVNWFLPMNIRLVLNLTEPHTINLHPNPQDGARIAVIDKSGNLSTDALTFMGNGRTIEGATSLTLNTDNYEGEWFYREDLGNWQKLAELALDDESPFPKQYDDMLIIGLAMRINPRHATEIDPQSLKAFNRSLSQFRARYSPNISMPSEEALIALPSQKRRWQETSIPGEFDRGYPIWW